MRKQQFSLVGLRFKEGFDDHDCKRSARRASMKISLPLLRVTMCGWLTPKFSSYQMAYAYWCAPRAVAFAAISRG